MVVFGQALDATSTGPLEHHLGRMVGRRGGRCVRTTFLMSFWVDTPMVSCHGLSRVWSSLSWSDFAKQPDFSSWKLFFLASYHSPCL
jgi:hypothetical protein